MTHPSGHSVECLRESQSQPCTHGHPKKYGSMI